MRKKANDFGQVHPRGLEAVGLGVGGAKTQVAMKSSVLIEGENKKICNNHIFWYLYNDILYTFMIFRAYRINIKEIPWTYVIDIHVSIDIYNAHCLYVM